MLLTEISWFYTVIISVEVSPVFAILLNLVIAESLPLNFNTYSSPYPPFLTWMQRKVEQSQQRTDLSLDIVITLPLPSSAKQCLTLDA